MKRYTARVMQTVPYPERERRDEKAARGGRLVVAMSALDPLGRANPGMPCTIDLSGVHLVIVERAPPDAGFSVVRGRFGSKSILTAKIPDVHLSGNHICLTLPDDPSQPAEASDESSTNGTWHNGARIGKAWIRDRDVLAVGSTILVYRTAEMESRGRRAGPSETDVAEVPDTLRTFHPGFSALVTQVRRMAPSDMPLLVHGETGVGKEVMARAIHQLSGRHGRFVALNCGAVTPSLLAPALFGVERGAYTGAHQSRVGAVRSAHEGTLLLDEIGELPLESQAVLLRVVEDKQVLPLGGDGYVPVDIRIIAATHRDLEAEVARGAFRHDLLARLGGYTLELPPLRERCEDIGLLIARLLPEVAPEGCQGIEFERQAASRLFEYHWPDNVRGLRQTLQAAVLMATDGVVRLEHLPAHVAGPAAREAQAQGTSRRGPVDRVAQERELRELLARHEGNISAVARAMNTSNSQVRRLLTRYGIERS